MNILADIIERVLVRIARMQNTDDPDEVAHVIILRFLANNIRINKYARAYLNQAVRFEIYTQTRDKHRRWVKAEAYAVTADTITDHEAYLNAKFDLDNLIMNHRTDFERLVRYSQAYRGNKDMSPVEALRLRKRLKAEIA